VPPDRTTDTNPCSVLEQTIVPHVLAGVEPDTLCPDPRAVERARFIQELHAENIGASVHFIPVRPHPYFHDQPVVRSGDCPVAAELPGSRGHEVDSWA
jgi:hypothetical protein